MVVAPHWTGREAAALRRAQRMSIRAYAAHLGVAVTTVANWERRREDARLRTDTQQLLDIDLARAPGGVQQRFAVLLTDGPHEGGCTRTDNGEDAARPACEVMNRDDAVKALGAQPFDHEVVVNVAGTYVDVVRIRHDERRLAVVLDLQPDDVQDILDGFGLSASN